MNIKKAIARLDEISKMPVCNNRQEVMFWELKEILLALDDKDEAVTHKDMWQRMDAIVSVKDREIEDIERRVETHACSIAALEKMKDDSNEHIYDLEKIIRDGEVFDAMNEVIRKLHNRICDLEGYGEKEVVHDEGKNQLLTTKIECRKLSDIQNIYDIQVNDPSSKTDTYMRGMANGMIMLKSILDGRKPEFIGKPSPEVKGEKPCEHQWLEGEFPTVGASVHGWECVMCKKFVVKDPVDTITIPRKVAEEWFKYPQKIKAHGDMWDAIRSAFGEH